MKLGPGTMITDKVRLKEPLREGGMGAIWVADHLTLDMTVAVKFILMDLAEASPEVFSRFEREAKAAAQIKSPHVVQVFDHGISEDGTPYIVMEKLDGNTLAEWLELIQRMNLADVGKIVTQVASALFKAHRIGVVHRDIKPDNVFLVEDEDDIFVKLFDFGIAKTGDATNIPKLTAHGALMGTPVYMSPEQTVNAKDVDASADCWALAVLAYEALTGELPFEGETLGALVLNIMDGEYVPISSRLGASTPAGLDGWFARAFHNDKERRFPGAREMAEAFAQLVKSERSGVDTDPADTMVDRRPRGRLATVARTMAEQAPRRRPPPPADPTLASADHQLDIPRQRRPPRVEEDFDRPRYRDERHRDGRRARPRDERLRDERHRDERPPPRGRRRPPPDERRPRRRRPSYDEDVRERFDDLEPLGGAVDASGRSLRGSVDFEGMNEAIETAADGPRVRPVVAAGVTKLGREQGERPLRDVLSSILVVALTTLVEPLLVGIAGKPSALEQRLGDSSRVVVVVALLAFLAVGARVWDRGHKVSWLLQVAGAGLVGVAVALAGSLLAPRLGLVAHTDLLLVAQGLAALAVPLGFGAFAALRGRDEISVRGDVGYGVALLILAVAAAGAAYKLGRTPYQLLVSGHHGAAVSVVIRQ